MLKKTYALLLLLFVIVGCGVSPESQPPLQIGCWLPLKVDAPKGVFPMVTKWWPFGGEGTTVDQFVLELAEEINQRSPTQPVWINTPGWFGYYKKGLWDSENVMAFREDVTSEGTPGIWPDKGIVFWKARHKRLLSILKEQNVQVEHWPLDHETRYHEWAHNFRDNFVFRNMVQDPRWHTEYFPGTRVKGIDLLDPKSISGETLWKKLNWKDEPKHVDIRSAYEAVLAPSFFVRPFVIDEVFTKPTLEAYPQCTVSDFGQVPFDIDFKSKTPLGPWSQKVYWDRLHKVDPAPHPSTHGGQCRGRGALQQQLVTKKVPRAISRSSPAQVCR